MDWNYYKNLYSVNGNNEKEIEINELIEELNLLIPENASCKDVVINDKEHKLVILDEKEPYIKKIITMPNDNDIYSGDIVNLNGSSWLIKNLQTNEEIYKSGKMYQCNIEVKWINKKGNIIKKHAASINSSEFGAGVNNDKVIETGKSIMNIWLPFDDETMTLTRGTRMFIDNNIESPTPFEVIDVNTVTNVYNGYGVISVVFKESQFNSETDNVELMICDYYKRDNQETEKGQSKIVFKSNYIVAGYSKGFKFTSEFYDNNGNKIDASPIWSVNCSFKDKLLINTDGNYINIAILDEGLIGRSFTLLLNGEHNGLPFEECKQLIEIVGNY